MRAPKNLRKRKEILESEDLFIYIPNVIGSKTKLGA